MLLEHAVVMRAQRTPSDVVCPLHGRQAAIWVGDAPVGSRLCHACWTTACSRVTVFAQMLLEDCVPLFFPGGEVRLPRGYEAFKAHLQGGGSP